MATGTIQRVPKILHGKTSSTTDIPAGGYVDVEFSFGYTFPATPTVVVSFDSNSTAGAFGECSIATNSVTTTGFKARLFNAGSSTRAPRISWIAVY